MNIKNPTKLELPSKNEQLSLQNTEILLKSNLMRMQLTELLVNVRDSNTSSRHIKIEKWLEKVCDTLSNCKVTDSELSTKWLTQRNLCGLNLEGYGVDEISIAFEKPSSVQVVGSHALSSGTAPFLTCDLAVVMPKSCFDARDVLNNVYFNKRKLYLAAISEVLSTEGLCSSIEVSYFKADHRKPFLIVKPSFNTKYSMHLYLCAPTGVFKLVQLLSSKNNVRPDSWMQELQLRRAEPMSSKKSLGKKVAPPKSIREESLDPSSLSPTPHYNMAILEDLAVIPQFRMLTKASESCPCFKDVCMLLKVWLAKKSLRFGISDLGGHGIKMVVAYLFQSRRIGQQTSALGAFQIVLSFFVETKFISSDLYFANGTNNRNLGTWSAKLYHPVGKDADDVQFNSLWRVSSSSIQDLQSECKIALGLLQVDTDVSFNRLFLEDSNYLSRFDLIFHIPLKSSDHRTPSDGNLGVALSGEQDDMTLPQSVSSRVLSVTRRALNDRVKIVSTCVRYKIKNDSTDPLGPSVSSWDRFSPPKNPSDCCVVTMGLVLDNDHAHRRVDKGIDPSVDVSAEGSDEAADITDFRSFWGRKSELRRFRDGGIVDAVVWGEQDSEMTAAKTGEVTGESIVESIVRYSLGMHLPGHSGPKGELITSMGSSLEDALPAVNYVRRDLSEEDSNSSKTILNLPARVRYSKAVESLDKLRRILTSDMKDLPLVFESISGSQASLRYTSTLPPTPHPLLLSSRDMLKEYSGVSISLVAQPMLIVGQVEGGGKWPTEVEAAKKIKTALLQRTGHLLRMQFEILSQPSHDFLDIFYDGFIFRLVIFFSSENSSSSEIRRLELSSLHHQSIRALHTQHGDPFSHSVRLFSLWLSKHYFSGFFSHKQIELLAASVFLDPSSLQAPTTSASALFRILDTLGKHDFDTSPLEVIFESDLIKGQGQTSKQAAEVFKIFQTTSEHTRSSLLTLSSNDLMRENFGDSLHADSAVERVSLSLIQKCAAESALNLVARALQSENTSPHPIDENIFHDSVLLDEQCNLVLQFNTSIQCKGNRGHLSGPKFASLKVYSNTVHAFCNPSRLVIGDASSSSANIIQEGIVNTLRKQFQDVAIFFWDETEGDRLGVILKPSAFVTSNFSSTNSRRKMPIMDGSKAHLPMLSDISQIAMNIFASGNGCFSDISFR